MAKQISGTLRSIMIEGITFRAAADINVVFMGSSVESEMIPTSGDHMRKVTKRVRTLEGVTLILDDAENSIMKNFAEEVDKDLAMSIELASGSVYTANGAIEFESRETQENRASIIMQPRDDWSEFINN